MYVFLKDNDNLPVVTDVHIRYQREIRIFDNIKIESFCALEKPYLIFRQKIINLSTGFSSARAITKLIFIDKDKIPRDVPVEVLSAINNGIE